MEVNFIGVKKLGREVLYACSWACFVCVREGELKLNGIISDMIDINEIWSKASEALKASMNADTYDRWIAGIVPVRITEKELVLGVSNDMFCDWLSNHYKDVISETLEKTSGLKRRLVFESGHEKPQETVTAEAVVPSVSEMPSSAAPSRPSMDLNSRFTFDRFVVGDGSRYAFGACTAVAASPGTAYNPLLIHSSIGLGKTHLLQAISHEVLSRNPNAKVEYLTSEEFCNQFTKALQYNKLPEFREHFRDINVLLIDDVQFFGTKTGFQEEFFHTFNAMHANHRQIVMASDRPPQEINGLEKRLVSRFECGVTAEIQPPDLETRIAIIRKKQEEQSVKLSDEVINYLAAHLKSSVRRLEGAVFNLVSHASLTKQTVTIEVAEKVLGNIFMEESDTQVTVEHIQHLVAEHYDIHYADMKSKRRPASVAWPRQVAMYFARRLTNLSFPDIANEFDRTHATVLHAVTTVEKKLASDQNFKREMIMLERKLKS